MLDKLLSEHPLTLIAKPRCWPPLSVFSASLLFLSPVLHRAHFFLHNQAFTNTKYMTHHQQPNFSMSQDQQQSLPVDLGGMGNGSNLTQNLQDASFMFNAGMLPNGAGMMGQAPQNQAPQQNSPLMQPLMGGGGMDPQPQNQQQNDLQQQVNQMQQQQQVQPNQQQQPQQGFNVNELKRLQQYGGGGQVGPQQGLLGGMGGQQQAMNQQAMLLQSMQSMLDQKVQNPRFDSNTVFNPMFQAGLMPDARLLMAQSQFPMGMQNMGEVPLPSPHSLFHRDGTRRMRGYVSLYSNRGCWLYFLVHDQLTLFRVIASCKICFTQRCH